MINLTPSPKQIEKAGEAAAIENVKKDVCKFLDAVGASRKFDPTLESYVGARFFAKTRVSKERIDANTGVVYGEQSEIASLIPAS